MHYLNLHKMNMVICVLCLTEICLYRQIKQPPGVALFARVRAEGGIKRRSECCKHSEKLKNVSVTQKSCTCRHSLLSPAVGYRTLSQLKRTLIISQQTPSNCEAIRRLERVESTKNTGATTGIAFYVDRFEQTPVSWQ